ncbi:acetaldehyde dehydrogenase (acetylating) [Chloroherpeton thalassium ATCC 35110]|uniref:Acetaldehyde dehydrogenase (Acetylating) n=1 Tax=Chloroherpeton thalassium (strain ATCC 35110 / GB-78) TaxID=517418 RepID=B3QXZ6_CHLT3|nr:acetaldehyde dehydrogenase (acetylating) [Chloroherpeton thalassium]ACF13524.1 acetaldehyde dehydrogenase (acetylating) [Chloroherpeton thalassium ATCC 35110]
MGIQLSNDLLSIQEARDLLQQAAEALKTFKHFSQEKVDAIVKAMAEAGYEAREELAKMAVEETGFGKVEDKILKNILGSKTLYEYIAPMKTCGIIDKRENGKIWDIATPMGVVAALIPSTNPTSTMLYKSIISLKSRNAIVASPHPAAKKCTARAAQIMREAAVRAGAPEGLIHCMTNPTLEGTGELMKHSLTGVILATGSTPMVKAAYSSGKPAYGVGPGNVPAFIERTANVKKAVADIIFGKTFDNGTICASEQAVVCDLPIKSQVIEEMKKRGAYFLNPEEKETLSRFMFPRGLNAAVVGKPAAVIAAQAGITVPETTKVLVAELAEVGKMAPLSAEKLSPVLAFYTEDGWEAGCRRCMELLDFGGIGHSLSLHSQNEHVIMQFAMHKPAHRILINTVSSVGAVGYTTALAPSLTLGPGTIGGSITTENVGPMQLLNIKRVAFETNPVNDKDGNPVAQAAVASKEATVNATAQVATQTKPSYKKLPESSIMAEIEERIRLKAGNTPAGFLGKKVTPVKENQSGKLTSEEVDEIVKTFQK